MTPLEQFALAVLHEARDSLCDLDGGWIQDKGVELGVLVSIEVTEPCDPETCRCAEYGDFPMTCYRIVPQYDV